MESKEYLKEKFLKNGYCVFQLQDINPEFYYYLEKYFVSYYSKNLNDIFYTFRFDSDTIETTYTSKTNSFTDANSKKDEFLNEHKNSNISQCWFYNTNIDNVNRIFYEIDSSIALNLNDILSTNINKILKFFYTTSEDSIPNITIGELQFTLYNKGCLFTPHHDGANINLCSIIIYLNKDYKKENGGLFVIDKYEIIPEFGTVCLMDLSKHDIRHGVTPVIGDLERYAILSFPKLK